MIDIVLYRQRIGSYSRKMKDKKFLKYSYFEADNNSNRKVNVKSLLASRTLWVRAILIICTVSSLNRKVENNEKNEICHTTAQRNKLPSALGSPYFKNAISIYNSKARRNYSKFNFCHTPAWTLDSTGKRLNRNWSKFLGNFFARYMNGNGKHQKGVQSLHLNIRSVQNKVGEIKQIVKKSNPHFLGLSECELRKDSQNFNIENLKVPGYNIYFPKSWDLHGYARVLVYYKKTLNCSRVPGLEDEHLQSIWVKFGFKNSRAGYYCHGYREHKSNLGNSLQAQKEKLDLFLNQWERALYHGNPSEPNEVFILGDMNIDTLDGKWLQRDYSLYSLSQMVNTFCNANNMSQIVKEATRV